VITSTERAYEADHVVLSVAPPVWNRIKIEPELPRGLRPQVGNTVKYVAALQSRFWGEGAPAPRAISDGEIELVWEATAGERAGEGAALVAQSGGPAADACRAREGDALERAYKEQLELLVPGSGAAFRGGRLFDWPEDPWTRCATSFPAPGEVTRLGPQWRRAAGRIRFAGEHTSTKFPGTMEGALDSGVALAREIASGKRTPMRAV
jgi:monoamine oxidase